MQKPCTGLLLVCLCILTMQQVSLADDLTTIVQTHYQNMKNFTAEFQQKLTHRESGSVENRRGRILFRRPLQLRFDTRSPREELLLITDSVIWNYIPDEKVAYQYNPKMVQGAANIIHVITGQSDLMRDFDVKRMGIDQDLLHLKLYPKKPTTQLVEADIWVDPRSGVIRRSLSTDFYGNTNEIAFSSYEENTSQKDSLYSFRPPKGVDIEDKRNETEDRDLLR